MLRVRALVPTGWLGLGVAGCGSPARDRKVSGESATHRAAEHLR